MRGVVLCSLLLLLLWWLGASARAADCTPNATAAYWTACQADAVCRVAYQTTGSRGLARTLAYLNATSSLTASGLCVAGDTGAVTALQLNTVVLTHVVWETGNMGCGDYKTLVCSTELGVCDCVPFQGSEAAVLAATTPTDSLSILAIVSIGAFIALIVLGIVFGGVTGGMQVRAAAASR